MLRIYSSKRCYSVVVLDTRTYALPGINPSSSRTGNGTDQSIGTPTANITLITGKTRNFPLVAVCCGLNHGTCVICVVMQRFLSRSGQCQDLYLDTTRYFSFLFFFSQGAQIICVTKFEGFILRYGYEVRINRNIG